MENALKVKGIYADGMVLQQNTTNCIFGSCTPNRQVIFSFRGIRLAISADEMGEWKIEFNPGSAGGPFEMEIRSELDAVTFKDVYVGEVWLLSGQSNAQLPMDRMRFSYPEEYALKPNPEIRMITIPISWSFDGEKDTVQNPTWVYAGSPQFGQMSGTGYFFAKKLHHELGVPVGIVNSSQGGSPIASWMNKQSLIELENSQMFISQLEKYENPENVKAKQKEESEAHAQWDKILYSSDSGTIQHWEKLSATELDTEWKNVTIPSDIPVSSASLVWFKKSITLTAEQVQKFNSIKTWLWLGTIVDADKVYVNGVQVGETGYCYPPRRYVVPEGTLKSGENTITIRVQKNSRNGKIRFYKEKPYFLFTENVKICPTAIRNVEKFTEQNPEDGVKIPLSGVWKMKYGTKVQDAPGQTFFEWVPTALYNSMLAPCFNYAIAGALWYQGESDAWHPDEYRAMLMKMIMLWRFKFNYAVNGMPFIIMQLPNWSDGFNEDYVSNNVGWAQMRQEQLLVTEIVDNTGLAVTIDAGEWNDLHPEKKRTGGTRAAVEALRVAYNKKCSAAPKAIFTQKKDSNYIIQFSVGREKLRTLSGTEVPGFYYLYEKGNQLKIYETKGKIISENEVSVPIPQIRGKIVEIRYLWSDNPAPVNLYSTAGLPAQAFRAIVPSEKK